MYALDDIDNIANSALQMFNVPGMAIGIVIDDQIILSRGYGFCNVSEKCLVTEHTLFPIASCTKAFTALALSQLVEEGKVALDDLVKNNIPEFCLMDQDTTNNLTIPDLLAHRTGIARHDPIWFYSDIPRSRVIGILKYFEPVCRLREEFQYNSFMYSIAGVVIERITGQSWEDVISTRLLDPLEMKDSNVSLKELQRSSDFSLPHAKIDGIVKNIPFRNTFSVESGGGINSNILDMTHWVRFQLSDGNFLNKNIVQAQTLKELHTMQMPFSSPPIDNEEIRDENKQNLQKALSTLNENNHSEGTTYLLDDYCGSSEHPY